MLSQAMTDCLNKQINLEMFSSNLYLQMGSWCAYKGLDGCASFLIKHADEEMGHMRRLLAYVNETGSLATLGSIDAPETIFKSVSEIFKKTYEHEQLVTSKINELVHLAHGEKDYATLQFLQWYIAEQHQEEFLFKSILDKIEIIGTEGQGMFFIDREIGQLATQKGMETTSMTNAGDANIADVAI
ncbi:MAG: non-heme ferritin [Prochloraceae cyanobacterium]